MWQVDTIPLDFAKDFTRFPVLGFYINETTMAYEDTRKPALSSWKQCVGLDGCKSLETGVITVVPQETFLGQLLCMAFINDQNGTSTATHDTLLMIAASSARPRIGRMLSYDSKYLKALEDWDKAW